VIPELRKLKQEDQGFEASLENIARPSQKKKKSFGWVLVAHVYNPSYSGGREQENLSSRPAQELFHENLSQKKKPSQKKGWWSDSR
jgi:hypothetical protein